MKKGAKEAEVYEEKNKRRKSLMVASLRRNFKEKRYLIGILKVLAVEQTI